MTLIANNIQERIDKGEWRKDNKSYILHASTFLNQKRWEDEVLEKQHEKEKSKPKQKGTIKDRSIEDALTDTSWAN